MTRRQRGFVLPLVLWVLAAMAIVVGIFALRIMNALDLAKASQQRVQGLIDINDTRSELLFRLGTTPMSVYGLGSLPEQAIRLDDRPYRGEGQSVVRLQDDRGLLNLNVAGEERIRRLLGIFGVPFEQRGRLIDALGDYIDEDDFKRLNGAEAREYAALGLPLPRNDKLLTTFEAARVLSWRDFPELWRVGGLADLTTVGTAVALNPNTAPWQVLATLPGITDDLAQTLIDARNSRPLRSVDDLALLIGVPGGNLIMSIIPFPSEIVRLTHSLPGQNWAVRYSVTLTPYNEHAPWRFDYQSRIELPYADDSSASLPPLPDKSALPANSGTSLLPF